MAITKQKKVEILSKLQDSIGKSQSIVFVNFHKMPVVKEGELRKSLRSNGVGYMVAKKTLIRKAFESQTVAGDMPALDGEIAIAYSEDMLAPAKGVYDFQKQNADMAKIVGGVFEGKFLDAAAMMTIATIPGREVLLGQFVNLLNSPIQGLVMALDQIAKKRA